MQKITLETLIPISIVGFIAVGSFYLSASNAKILENASQILENKTSLKNLETETNKNYVEIIQRLSRIEEAVKNGRD